MDKIILNLQNFIERAENASGKTCKIADKNVYSFLC